MLDWLRSTPTLHGRMLFEDSDLPDIVVGTVIQFAAVSLPVERWSDLCVVSKRWNRIARSGWLRDMFWARWPTLRSVPDSQWGALSPDLRSVTLTAGDVRLMEVEPVPVSAWCRLPARHRGVCFSLDTNVGGYVGVVISARKFARERQMAHCVPYSYWAGVYRRAILSTLRGVCECYDGSTTRYREARSPSVAVLQPAVFTVTYDRGKVVFLGKEMRFEWSFDESYLLEYYPDAMLSFVAGQGGTGAASEHRIKLFPLSSETLSHAPS